MPLFTVEENFATKTSSAKQHFKICTSIRDSMTNNLSQTQIKITIFREQASSALAGFHAGPLSWSNWIVKMLVFVEGGKPENLNKNPQSNVRTNNKLDPHMASGLNRSRALTTPPSLLTSHTNDCWFRPGYVPLI